jgi:hypothetical protein
MNKARKQSGRQLQGAQRGLIFERLIQQAEWTSAETHHGRRRRGGGGGGGCGCWGGLLRQAKDFHMVRESSRCPDGNRQSNSTAFAAATSAGGSLPWHVSAASSSGGPSCLPNDCIPHPRFCRPLTYTSHATHRCAKSL